MFRHYLIIALRNIRKYALQNTVSCIGLAAGLVCLSFSALWIHFEESFDTFHKDADRIYTLSVTSQYSVEPYMAYLTPERLEPLLEFSEIESYTKLNWREHGDVKELIADPTFFKYFDISLIEGDWSFLKDTNYVALSSAYAGKRFPFDDPIGQDCYGKTVCAVVAPFSGPSYLKFDILCLHDFPMVPNGVVGEVNFDEDGNPVMVSWNPNITFYTQEDRSPIGLFKLHEGTDAEKFEVAMNEKLKKGIRFSDNSNYKLLPISEIHKLVTAEDMYIGYEHARLFAWASLLLTLCALVNFLLFNLNRVRNREHETALRIVHGATGRSVLSMMAVESGIILGTASVLGLLAIVFLKDKFRELADIEMTTGYVLWGSVLVIAIAFVISMAVSIISVGLVRHRTMQGTLVRKTGKTFRQISIGIQIFVSVLFLFVIFSMLHQFRFLRNNNWGIRVNDIAVITIPNPENERWEGFQGYMTYTPEDDPYLEKEENGDDYLNRIDGRFGIMGKLESIPFVTDVYRGIGGFSEIGETAMEIFKGEEIWLNGSNQIKTNILDILDTTYMKLLSLNVLDGTIPDRPLVNDEIVITRKLQRELGLGDIADAPTLSIVKNARAPFHLSFENGTPTISGGEVTVVSNTFRIIAIIDDMYLREFSKDPESYILCGPKNRLLLGQTWGWSEALITMTYRHGSRKELKQRVDDILKPTELDYELKFTEDDFYQTLTNDRHLTTLIEVLGILCLIISLAGIYSIIALSCQEKKREIAVRKVHGARVTDILSIFIRSYGILFLVSSALGFMVGYPVIKVWQQQFRLQAVISWWIYAAIFTAMALVICLTVGHRVLKTARENPADVIKSE